MNKPIQHVQANTDEISLFEILTILREGWVVLAVCIVLGLIIALVVAQITTPVYRATTTIAQVKRGGGDSGASALIGQLGGLANVAGVSLRGLGGSASDGLTIIQSRTFVEKFVAEQDLMPLVYSDLWNDAGKDWNADVKRAPRLWQGANKFISNYFNFSEDNETGLFSLSVEWPDPEKAAMWANRLVELVNETARQRDIEGAEISIAYLKEQIEQTDVVEFQRVLYNLLEAEQKTLMLANAHKDYAFTVVDPAVVPVSIARPKPVFLAVLGLFAGGFLGLIIVFGRAILRGLDEQRSARVASE